MYLHFVTNVSLCFYPLALSAMIRGAVNDYVTVVDYQVEEIEKVIETFLKPS